MAAPFQWSLRSLAAAAVLAVACGSAAAQFGQPGGLRPVPGQPAIQKGQPNPNARNPLLMPSINSWPGLPAYQTFPPVVGLPDGMNSAADNPWMNRANVIRVRNPFAMNPFWNNPFVLT